MASNLYEINTTKTLLNIEITDTVDDEILNMFGAATNQHMDNIFMQHDERIPLKVPRILADWKMAANYRVCALFRGKRGDVDTAKFWEQMHLDAVNGIIAKLSIDGTPQVVERFTGRRFNGDSHYLAEW